MTCCCSRLQVVIKEAKRRIKAAVRARSRGVLCKDVGLVELPLKDGE